MFAPTKVCRRWHKRVNLNQCRYAMCSALAATALPSLVMAQGHHVDNIGEVPDGRTHGPTEPGRSQLSREDTSEWHHGLFPGSFLSEKPLLFRKLTDENVITFTYPYVAVLSTI